MSSYYGFINWIDASFRAPEENHNADAANGAGIPVPAQLHDQGNLDHWKVAWRKEGAKFGKATCGVVGGLITNFSVLPLMIGSLAGGLPPAVATPALMSGMAYNAGAWVGGHLGYYIGYGVGAIAAETFDVLFKISSKLYQWAQTLFASSVARLGCAPSDDLNEDNGGPPAPPSSRRSPAPEEDRGNSGLSNPPALDILLLEHAPPVLASAPSEIPSDDRNGLDNLSHQDDLIAGSPDAEDEAQQRNTRGAYGHVQHIRNSGWLPDMPFPQPIPSY